MDDYNNGYTPDPNQYQNPEQPVQPDYASQYNQDQNTGYDQQYGQNTDYTQQYQDPNAGYQQYQDPNAGYQQYQDPNAGYQQYQDPNAGYNQYQDPNAGYNQQAYNLYDNPQDGVLAGPAKVFSIISLVCGIVSMVSCYVGFVPGIAAIVFSVLAKKRYTGKNTKAQLGLIFGIIGLVLAVISVIVYACIVANSYSSYSSYSYY